MQINFAHMRERATNGSWINFAVFETRATVNSESANAQALAQLTAKARRAGYQVDQSALAFTENGNVRYYGSKNLVNYLVNSWMPHWTHTMSV